MKIKAACEISLAALANSAKTAAWNARWCMKKVLLNDARARRNVARSRKAVNVHIGVAGSSITRSNMQIRDAILDYVFASTKDALMSSFRLIFAVGALALATSACTQMQPIPYTVDAHVPVTPQTISWGHLSAGQKPVLRVRSGQTVAIDTLSHPDVDNGLEPVTFFAAGGIAGERSEEPQG